VAELFTANKKEKPEFAILAVGDNQYPKIKDSSLRALRLFNRTKREKRYYDYGFKI